MDSFEELNLPPELVEALAAEGIERPTSFQASVIPVVLRENNLVACAGPGAGILVALIAPLLARIEPDVTSPAVLVLTPTGERASALAESMGRLAQAMGHRVAAAEGPWALPERASVLVTTPADALAWLHDGRLSLEGIAAFVLDGGANLQVTGDLEAVETILEGLDADAQRVFVSLPLTPEVEDLAERHAKRAVHVPPRAAQTRADDGPRRGDVQVRVVGAAREAVVAELCAEVLAGEARHVVLFVRSDDAAADLGDHLALHGFHAGPPGQADLPVWLAVEDMEGRAAMDEAGDGVLAVSVDMPFDPDALDRRHGGGRGGLVLAEPRELPHLRDVARRTGYTLTVCEATSAPRQARGSGLRAVLDGIEQSLSEDALDVDAYQVVLEPLIERHGASRVAAAALGLLRARGLPAAAPAAGAVATSSVGAPSAAVTATVRLFVSLGQRDGIGPGDLVGAITGESGIEGKQIGRIDLRESFSLVEVEAAVADRVIKALNGTTVKGRSVRVDLDRNERARGSGRPSGGGSRRPAGRGGPRRG